MTSQKSNTEGNRRLTVKRKSKYISSGGTQCPYCESKNIFTMDFILGENIRCSQGCHACLQRWTDTLRIIEVRGHGL